MEIIQGIFSGIIRLFFEIFAQIIVEVTFKGIILKIWNLIEKGFKTIKKK